MIRVAYRPSYAHAYVYAGVITGTTPSGRVRVQIDRRGDEPLRNPWQVITKRGNLRPAEESPYDCQA
jgi:hypothetical protein